MSDKKSQKAGRNANWCKAYRQRGQREINKIRKVLRHILHYGTTDHAAVKRYNELPIGAKPANYRILTPTKTKHKGIQPARPML